MGPASFQAWFVAAECTRGTGATAAVGDGAAAGAALETPLFAAVCSLVAKSAGREAAGSTTVDSEALAAVVSSRADGADTAIGSSSTEERRVARTGETAGAGFGDDTTGSTAGSATAVAKAAGLVSPTGALRAVPLGSCSSRTATPSLVTAAACDVAGVSGTGAVTTLEVAWTDTGAGI